MKRKLGILASVLLLASLAVGAAPAGAQNLAGISGTLIDQQGKPMPGYLVIIKSTETGLIYTMKTDKNGMYRQIGIRPGVYEITVKAKDKEPAIVEVKCQVPLDPDFRFDIDLRAMRPEQTPEQQAARKKQEEEQKKFENMKAAFMDGQTKVEQADQAHAEMMKAPADQRAGLQPKVNGLYEDALHSFQQAQQAAPEKDPNLPLLYAKLGYANEMLGNYDEAIADYQKAIALKPMAEYYNVLSLAQARAGKIPDAEQSCDKSAALDPTKGTSCWLNLGIVLYNKNQLADAVAPLQKATALNPKNPQAWYLLGASLVATMTVKQEGEKMIPVLAPGTVEAYQKCIELDPSGPWGDQARQGLAQLQAMGAGVDTKIKVKKGKG